MSQIVTIEVVESNLVADIVELDASFIRALSDLELSDVGGGTDITNGF
jgi:hypothetical protein